MKIVVIGGTGLIGSKLVTHLTKHGHIRLEDWLRQIAAITASRGVNGRG